MPHAYALSIAPTAKLMVRSARQFRHAKRRLGLERAG